MTHSLFDNAKFGDIFITVEKKQAVFLRLAENAEYKFAILYVEDWGMVQVFRHNGKEIHNDAAHSIISKQEEPVSGDFEIALAEMVDKAQKCVVEPLVIAAQWKDELIKLAKIEEPASEDLIDEIKSWLKQWSENEMEWSREDIWDTAEHFAKWQKAHNWKPADGDDLPDIDREVIALLDNGKVVFAHRPPEYWDGKDIVTGKVTRNYPKTYDKGGWNIPNIKYWLDCQIPNMWED